MARIANLFAIAIFSLIVISIFNLALDNQIATQHVSAVASHALDAQRSKLAAAEVPASIDAGTRKILQQGIAESFMLSFRVAMLMGAGLAFISSLCAALTVPSRRRKVKAKQEERQCGDNACTLMYAHRSVDTESATAADN
ncbi:hypothetical protein [Dictyobacter kobayashii]|uniref:Uncharacterized protein n=1 Tax=Dictyobacter kobayashii TaxID=2014872 RepID=A0A402ALB0_9CHLR|nr:hypothetical protein [Dictyobacter kobayashii]GCE19839.1 hypothetical protein KDK_36390 [Dictyobacter kobayashii]